MRGSMAGGRGPAGVGWRSLEDWPPGLAAERVIDDPARARTGSRDKNTEPPVEEITLRRDVSSVMVPCDSRTGLRTDAGIGEPIAS